MVFTSIHTIIFIQSHILRLQMGSTTFKGKLNIFTLSGKLYFGLQDFYMQQLFCFFYH